MADREQTLLFIVDVRVNNARALQALGRDMREELGAREERLVSLGQAAEQSAAGHQSLTDAINESNVAAARPISTPASVQSGASLSGARGVRNIGSKANPLVTAQESGQSAGLGSMAAAVGDPTTSTAQQSTTTPVVPTIAPSAPSSSDQQLSKAASDVAQKVMRPEDDRILNAITSEQQLRQRTGQQPLGQEMVDTLAAVRQSRMPAGVYATRPPANPEGYTYSAQHGGYIEKPRTLSAAETAGRLGVSTNAVRDLAAQGKIPGAQKISGQYVIPEETVTRMVVESAGPGGGGGGGGGGGAPPTGGGGGGGSDFFSSGGGGGGGRRRIMFNPFTGLTSRPEMNSPFSGRNLFFGNKGEGGAFGLPSLGSVGSLGGLGLEHWLLTALGLTASAGSAVAGAGLLGTAGLTKSVIGGGADALVNHATVEQTKSLIQAQNALNTAIATYGKNSTQAKVAQSQLNQAVQALGGGPAKQAIQQLAGDVQNLTAQFNKSSNAARAVAASVMDQAVGLASDYVPLVTAAAQRNLTIVNTGLKPLFAWLEGPQGIGIFNTLEDSFAQGLPTSIHAGSMALEDFLRLMQATVPFTGGLTKALNNFFTNKNQESAGQYRNEVEKLVGDFTEWKDLLKVLGQDLDVLFHADAGTANSIVGELTQMLTKLHDWETSVHGQMQLQTIFAVHKQQIDELLKVLPALLKGYGSFYLDVAPALVTAITDIAKAIGLVANAVEKIPGGTALVGLAIVLGKLGLLGPGLKATGLALGVIAGGEKEMGAASGGLSALAGGKAAVAGTAAKDAESGAPNALETGGGIASGSLLVKVLSRLANSGLGKAAGGAVETGALAAGGAAEGAGATGLSELLVGGGAALAPIVSAVVPVAAVALAAYGGYRFLKQAFGTSPATTTTSDTSAQLKQALQQQGPNARVPGQTFGGVPLTHQAASTFSQFEQGGGGNSTVSIAGLGGTKQAQTDLIQFQDTMRNTQAVAKMSAGQLEAMVNEGQALAQAFPKLADGIDKFVKQAQTDLQPIQTAMKTTTARWESDSKAGLGKLVDTFTQNIALIDNTVGGFQGKKLIHDQVNAMVAELTSGMASGRISVSKGMDEVNAALNSGLTNGAITWQQKWHEMFQVVSQLYASGKISAGQYQQDLHGIIVGGMNKINSDSASSVSKMNAHLKQLFSEGNDGLVQTRGELNTQIKAKDAQMNAQTAQDLIAYTATFTAGLGKSGAGGAAASGINSILATLDKALVKLGQSPISQVQLQAASPQGQLSQKLNSEAGSTPNAPSSTSPFSKGLATGGMMVNQPMFIVGEEAPAHPEYVLPTNPAYRGNAIDLWMSFAQDIGIPGFAAGGITAPRVTGGGGFGTEVQGALSLAAQAASQVLSKKQAQAAAAQVGNVGLPSVAGGSIISQIGQILLAHGLNKTGAAGIIGNALQESGWNPAAVGDGGGGLWGFTTGAISLASLRSFASSEKQPWSSVPVQTQFLLDHLSSGDIQAVNSAGSPQAAALWFMNNWEKPAAATANAARREAGAVTAYRALAGAAQAARAGRTTGGGLPGGVGVPTAGWNPSGMPVDNWIDPILNWAASHGWGGSITSGYRPPGEVVSNPQGLVAPQGQSNHSIPNYPGGAIDVGNPGAKGAGQALASVLSKYPRKPNLVWGGPVIGDWGHFSATGHARGGIMGNRRPMRGLASGGTTSSSPVQVPKSTPATFWPVQVPHSTPAISAPVQVPRSSTMSMLFQLLHPAVAPDLTAKYLSDKLDPTEKDLAAALQKLLHGLSQPKAIGEAESYATLSSKTSPIQPQLAKVALGVAISKLTDSLNGMSDTDVLDAAKKYSQSSMAIAPKLANVALGIAVTKTGNAIQSMQNSQSNQTSLAAALQGLTAGTAISSLGALKGSGLSAGQARSLVGGSANSYGVLAKIDQAQAGQLRSEQTKLEAEYKQAVVQHNKNLQSNLVGQLQGVDSALATAISGAQQALTQKTQTQITNIQNRVSNLTSNQGNATSFASALQGLAPGTTLAALGLNHSALKASGLSSATIRKLIGGDAGSYGALANLDQNQAGQLKSQQSQLEAQYSQALKKHNSTLATALLSQLQGVDASLASAISSGQQALEQQISTKITNLTTKQSNQSSLATALQGIAPGTSLSELGLTGTALKAAGLTKKQATNLIGGNAGSYGTLAKIYEAQAGGLENEQASLESQYKKAVKDHNKTLAASLKSQLQGVDTSLVGAIADGQQALDQQTQTWITNVQNTVSMLTSNQSATTSLATALQGLPAGTSLGSLGNLSGMGLTTDQMQSLVGGTPGSYNTLAGIYQGQAGQLQGEQGNLLSELAAANQSGNTDLATALVTELQTVDSDLIGAISNAQQAIVAGIQAQGAALDQIAQGFGTGQGILSSITNLAPGTDLSDLGITPAIAAALGLPAGYTSLEGTGITYLQGIQQTQGGVLTPAQLAAATTGTNALNSGIGTEIGGYESELTYDEGQLPNLTGTNLTSMQSTIYGLISTIIGLQGSIQDNNDSLTQLTQSVNGNTNATMSNTGAMTGSVSFSYENQTYLASDRTINLGVGS